MSKKSRRLMAAAIFLALGAAGVAAGSAWMGAGPAPAVDPAAVDLSALDSIAPQTWACLRDKRIFFGHQSVGANVVAGLREIQRLKPQTGLRIDEAGAGPAFDAPGFVHGRIGANGDVESKLSDFAAIMRGPLGSRADIALMKFCFAEIKSGANPPGVWENYRRAMEALQAAHPQTRFIHVTIPLMTVQTGPKATIKRLLGRSVSQQEENVLRNQYNRLLLGAYQATGAVFDLALAESRWPDGRRETFGAQGDTWMSLAPGYASDRGHLNPAGQLAAARDLLLVLAVQCTQPAGGGESAAAVDGNPK